MNNHSGMHPPTSQRFPNQPHSKAELAGNLVTYSTQQPTKDYCDKSYARRPNSSSKPTNTARTLIPDLQETRASQHPTKTTTPFSGMDGIMMHADQGNNITNCERKHSIQTNYSNVFNMNMAVKPLKPMFAKIATPMDRNINMIGSKGAGSLKDRAMEPCIISPSKNMKNFRDFRSSIVGMPGSTTSRQPLNNENKPSKFMGQLKNDPKINILCSLDNVEQNRSKQGKKKFVTKDAIIYGTIEKEEKMPNAMGRRGNKGTFNVFKSHIEGFA